MKLQEEAARCLLCQDAPCTKACGKGDPARAVRAVRFDNDGVLRRVCLRVSNTVSEVPDLGRIFDRFYRADSSRNQKSGGFGIGLSAAQTIAHLHRAELTAGHDPASGLLSFSVHFPPMRDEHR